jgi:4-amino-4-deoxy-L-arabinose transferase-like glycosyltransferase
LALLVATIRLVEIVPGTLSAAVHARAVAARLALALMAAAVAVVAALLAERRGHWRAALVLGFLVLIGLRLAAILLFTSPIVSDWRAYVELANGILDGQGFWAARATGYPTLLAAAFALGGRVATSGELLNLLIAVLTGGVLVSVLVPRFGRRAALIGLLAYAVVPSQVLFTVILGTEVLYAGCLVLLVLLLVRAIDRGFWWAVPLGVAFGLAQYIRPTSQYLLPAAIVVVFLAGLGVRRAVSLALIAIVAFGVVTAPIVAWNWTVNDRLSVAPYLFDGWILYVGIDADHNGTFNRADDRNVLAAVNGGPDPTVTAGRFSPGAIAWQRRYNEAAARLALERLRTNGIATLTMQPAKFNELWARSDDASHWIYRTPTTQQDRATRKLLAAASQSGWVLLLVGALAGIVAKLIAVRRTGVMRMALPPPEVTSIVMFLLATATIHTLAQVNDRFHEYLVPAFCALAALGWQETAGRAADAWGRRSAASRPTSEFVAANGGLGQS